MKLGKILLAFCLFFATFTLACDCDKGESNIYAIGVATNKAEIKSILQKANELAKDMIEFGENGDIEIVIGKDGAKIFVSKDEESKKLVREIQKTLEESKFVRILVCNGALEKNKIEIKKLPEGVKVAKSALRELVEKQMKGYALIPAN